MGVHDWFGTVSLDNAPPAARLIVQELAQMLDQVQPELLDPHTSHAIDGDHSWLVPIEVEIELRHRDDAESNISIGLGADEAIVAWVSTHEHISDRTERGDRPWTSVVVDLVAAILRGEYEVEETYRGKKLIKSKVIDRLDGRTVSTTGQLFGFLVPRRSRLETRRIDYATKG